MTRITTLLRTTAIASIVLAQWAITEPASAGGNAPTQGEPVNKAVVANGTSNCTCTEIWRPYSGSSVGSGDGSCVVQSTVSSTSGTCTEYVGELLSLQTVNPALPATTASQYIPESECDGFARACVGDEGGSIAGSIVSTWFVQYATQAEAGTSTTKITSSSIPNQGLGGPGR